MKLFRLAAITVAVSLSLSAQAAISEPLTAGVDKSQFDTSVRPQDNVFDYVNGPWIKATPIPADQFAIGAFYTLRDESEARSKTLLETAMATAQTPGSDEQKIADLYRSYMDEARLEKLGAAPVKPALTQIDQIANLHDLFATLGKLQYVSIDLPLNIGVGQDPDDARRYEVGVNQGGLGLPDRDYYLSDDARFAKAREAYVAYLTRLFTLAGEKAPAEQAKTVMALETAIAQVQWTNVENRDPVKTHNPRTRAALPKTAPDFDWNTWLDNAGLGSVAQVDISQPTYAEALGQLLKKQPLATWQSYLKARALDAAAPLLSKDFVQAHFALHGTALTGATEQRARWKRGVSAVNGSLGDALGKPWAAAYFPPESKARMEALVANLLKAYQQSIETVSWMSPPTRVQAQKKLAAYTTKIGYPSKWRDYSALEIKPDDLFGNMTRSAAYRYQYDLNRLGKPVDRTEWGMYPQTVNAYYNPAMNEIVFPAAILQAPFFNPKADDAANYGGIGAVIGHEISHGFDDQGSQYDGDGNLKNWWTPADRTAFEALTSKLVAQYDAYEPLPGKHVNGKLTLGENIADLSGLQIAYKAYHLSLNGKPAPVIDGLTGDQRFFLAFAQIWRGKMRDAALLRQVATDPHSPLQFRAIGASMNSDGFAEAFGTKPGDKMYKAPQDRIHMW
ncbi:M13 family metallopeptidase [Amantichitinum ursilacus]|uniref:Neutral endopeptidase n=1 Tax=Amantichitinum ursilacus TaxID=857265 RepID=A0A0N1JT53_9NEIS|nr:M13-type metalloendopeptidase [Amantichitinum ursilacus]KPC53714.1 Neutral endopeptidase [Amantichitinum ursilacus]